MVEDFAVTRALEQNRVPAQAGLRTFQDKKLEEHTVVVDRDAPFLVVIRNVDFFLRPMTANKSGIGTNRSHGVQLARMETSTVAASLFSFDPVSIFRILMRPSLIAFLRSWRKNSSR